MGELANILLARDFVLFHTQQLSLLHESDVFCSLLCPHIHLTTFCGRFFLLLVRARCLLTLTSIHSMFGSLVAVRSFFSRGHTMLLGQWSEIKLTNSSAPTGECCWLLHWKKKQFEVSAGWSSRNGTASNCRNWNARLCVITFQALERSYLCSRLKLHREEEKKESECLSHCHLITSSNTLIYVLIDHLIEFFTLNEECSSSLSSAVRDNDDNDRRREEVKKSVEIGNCR